MQKAKVVAKWAGRAVSYQRGLALQSECISANASCSSLEKMNVLLLLEHKPVYTVGMRKGSSSDSEVDRLKSIGADFHRSDRGGLITFHGPGQLVVYPIIDLRHFPVLKNSVRCYVDRLEQCIIELCAEFGILSERSEHTGVWVNDGRSKICAMGIHVGRFITSHGLALNCNTDLKWFDHIVPCGIVGKTVTSLSHHLKRDVPTSEVVPRFLNVFENVFDCDVKFDYSDFE